MGEATFYRNGGITMRNTVFMMVISLSLLHLSILASDMPTFSARDPAGAMHTHQELLERGAVIVVTIPNAKHGDFQSTWARHLEKQIPAGGPRLVMVEDLSQSNVRENALKSMKERFRPGQETMLLLDEDGSLRRAFGVQNDETVVLVYSKDGRLVQQVSCPETADGIVDAAKKVGTLVKGMAR